MKLLKLRQKALTPRNFLLVGLFDIAEAQLTGKTHGKSDERMKEVFYNENLCRDSYDRDLYRGFFIRLDKAIATIKTEL